MWRSSSATISRGVMLAEVFDRCLRAWSWRESCARRRVEWRQDRLAPKRRRGGALARRWPAPAGPRGSRVKFLDHDVAVGVDADVAGDVQRLGRDRLRASSSVCASSARAADSAYGPPEPIAIRPSSGSITSPVPLMISEVSASATASSASSLPEAALGAPVLGHLDRGALQLAVLLQLGLEQFEQGEGIGGRAGEAGQHAGRPCRAGAPCARWPSSPCGRA